jgi:prepilin-type N-terminal cleavage/methylation domain-containing protein
MGKAKGFTLIELLLSVTILTMIMLLATYSFSIFTSRWEGRLGHFAEHLSEAKDHILLNDIVSSTLPYVYRTKNTIGYYFDLVPGQLSAVTQSAIFHPDSPVVYRLSIEQLDADSFYLLKQEAMLTVLNANVEPVFTHEKILIAKAESISLEVLGWKDLQQKINSEDPLTNSDKKPIWRKEYHADKSNIMPQAVMIIWDGNQIYLPLVNEQASWLNRLLQIDK